MKPKSNTPGPRRHSTPAESLDATAIYGLAEGLRRLGWGQSALREAKKRGLPVLTFNSRSYLFGGDVLDFLRQQPAIDRNRGGGRPDLVAGRTNGEGQ